MKISLLSSVALEFTSGGASDDKLATIETGYVTVESLGKVESCSGDTVGSSTPSDTLLANLEQMLLELIPLEANKRRRLSSPLNCRLQVSVLYNPKGCGDGRSETGSLRISDSKSSLTCLLGQLASVCGGQHNLVAGGILGFGTAGRQSRLVFKDLPLMWIFADGDQETGRMSTVLTFDFPKTLAGLWGTQAKFTGTLSLFIDINSTAVYKIHSYNPESVCHLANRELLANASVNGDVVMVAKNGEEISCHKIILAGQSEVFGAMFANDTSNVSPFKMELCEMTESEVKAFLEYLYCGALSENLNLCYTAMKVLVASVQFKLPNLCNKIRDFILDHDNQWFSVVSAANFLLLGFSEPDNLGLRDVQQKAVCVLRTKPKDELKKSIEEWTDLSSTFAVQLLVTAEEYKVPNLYSIMNDWILAKENDSFSVSSALQLFSFAKVKMITLDCGEMEKKAVSILLSKQKEQLTGCADFGQMFNSPVRGMALCVSLIENSKMGQ